MKTLLLLICATAISSPCCGAAIDRSSNRITAGSSVRGGALQSQAPALQGVHGHRTALRAHGNLDVLRGTMVREMRATKAFVKENVVKQESADRGLMLLAAIGMVVLQLRSKHKSLPQRQIAPYA